jgi:RNA polymerase sigma-70 factor (ECF subfamily)
MEFKNVYRECSPSVRRTLLKLGVQEKDVADASQEVFSVVLRKLDGFEGRSEVATWVHGICRRVAADYRRRACNRHEVLAEDSGIRSVDVLAVVEARLAITSALKRLDAPKRKVVAAYALDDEPMQKVARKVRVPLQTAYARLYAGHRALRAMFEQEDRLPALPAS